MSWYSGTHPTLADCSVLPIADADHFEIHQQVVVRHHDALGRGGRTRRVLQEREIVAICTRRQNSVRIVRRIVHRADGYPVEAGITKALGHIGTAFEKFAVWSWRSSANSRR